MKKIVCIIMCFLSIATSMYSQTENKQPKIRSLARIHIYNTEIDRSNENKKIIETDPIELGLMDSDTENKFKIPKGCKVTIVDQMVYDAKNRVYITDDSMPVPISETLSHYRLSTLSPHSFRHPMFVKNGKYAIINMRKSLSEIIGQYNDMHNELMLNNSESRYVLNEILRNYETNDKNGGFVRIITDEQEQPLESPNIWEITSNFLVENGELDSGVNAYPEIINTDKVVFPFFIVTQNEIIKNPDFVLPIKKELEYYSFGNFAPYGPMHLIFFKNGKWHIINMHKTLPEIMSQFAIMYKELRLYNEGVVEASKEILKIYDMNEKIKATHNVINSNVLK